MKLKASEKSKKKKPENQDSTILPALAMSLLTFPDWKKLFESIAERSKTTIVPAFYDQTQAESAGLRSQFQTPALANTKSFTQPFPDIIGVSVELRPDSSSCQRADGKPLTTQDTFLWLLTLKQTNAEMLTEGIEIDEADGTPAERAMGLLMAQRLGFHVENEKALIDSIDAQVMNQAVSQFNAFFEDQANKAMLDAANEVFPNTMAPTIAKARENMLGAQDMGDVLMDAGLMDKQRYDDRGNAQAKLVAIREAYKAKRFDDTKLTSLSVGFDERIDRGNTVLGMKPFLEKFDQIDDITSKLGITNNDLVKARAFLDETGEGNKKLGANRQGETHQVPFMGEITNVAFSDLGKLEQSFLIVQQATRALATITHDASDAQISAYKGPLEKKPFDPDKNLQDVWAMHQRINSNDIKPDDAQKLAAYANAALAQINSPHKVPYQNMIAALARKAGVNPTSSLAPAPAV